jgi:hypothetical protein
MSQLKDQLLALEKSLDGFKAQDVAEWRVGVMANALLVEARKAAPDSAAIKAIEDFTPRASHDFVEDAKIGTIRATLRQVAEALPPDDAEPMVVKR